MASHKRKEAEDVCEYPQPCGRIAKLMKKVCIALHFKMSIPSPGGSDRRPMRPRSLWKNVRATSARTPHIRTLSIVKSALWRSGV